MKTTKPIPASPGTPLPKIQGEGRNNVAIWDVEHKCVRYPDYMSHDSILDHWIGQGGYLTNREIVKRGNWFEIVVREKEDV